MEELIKIIGIGLIALVIIIILKQYRPEYAIYVSIIAGILILFLAMEKLSGIINLLQSYKFSKKIEYGINTAHKKQGEVRVSQLPSPIISTKNEIIWLKYLNQ